MRHLRDPVHTTSVFARYSRHFSFQSTTVYSTLGAVFGIDLLYKLMFYFLTCGTYVWMPSPCLKKKITCWIGRVMASSYSISVYVSNFPQFCFRIGGGVAYSNKDAVLIFMLLNGLIVIFIP